MNIHDLFTQVRKSVANEDTHDLHKLKLTKPEYFNWVQEVFYEMNVKLLPRKSSSYLAIQREGKDLYIPKYL